jgi:hypothetical protein
MFFVAYPIVFQEGKGYSASTTGLMFIPIAVGVLLSAACAPLVNKHYMTLVRKHNGKPPAEARLIPMMVSCWCIPIGLFIFAWSSYPRLSWVGPCLPIQLGQQLPCRLLSAPSRQCSGSQDIPEVLLGCCSGTFYETDVRSTRLPVG